MLWPGDQQRGERVAIRIAVVAQHAGGGDGQGGIFSGGVAVVHRLRDIVDRGDVDRHRNRVTVCRSIRSPVAEGIRPGEVGVRRIVEGAIRIQVERTVLHAGNQDCGQRIPVGVTVVAQHAGGGDGQGGIFSGGIAVGGRHRRVVHRGDGETDRSRSALGLAVGRPVGKAVRPVIILGWGVGEGAIGIQRQRTVLRAGDQLRGERVAVPIVVIA